MTKEPFGAFPVPDRMAALLRHRKNGKTRIGRYLSKKAITRYVKAVARPFDIAVDGIRMRVCPKDNLHDRMLIMDGIFPEKDWFEQIFADLPENAVYVDIGANVGVFTLNGAKRLPAGSRILAIEPHPVMRDRLTDNLALNDISHEIQIEDCAIGPEEGSMILYQPSRRNTGVSTLHPDGSTRAKKSYTVPIKPLLSVLKDHAIKRIDVLKIDIEGFEDRALIPFFNTADVSLWPRRVFIEHDGASRWEADVIEDMKGRGYRIEAKDGQNMLLTYA